MSLDEVRTYVELLEQHRSAEIKAMKRRRGAE
jgi:hypothetical protein